MVIGIVHLSYRPDTWARYVVWELRRSFPEHEVVLAVEHVDSDQWRWSERKCDVYLRIDDSQAFTTPEWMRPIIYWASDTHVPDGVDRQGIAYHADFSFCCQPRAQGFICNEWLPHAAWYFPQHSAKPRTAVASAMVLAIDNPLFATRTKIAQRLRKDIPHTVIQHGIFHRPMANLYADAHIVWHHSVGGDLAMRHFEGAAAGACVLCNKIDNTGFDDIFDDLMVTYETEDEAVDKAKYLLAHPDECRERGHALANVAWNGHQYHHRVLRIIEKAKELHGQ